MAVLPDPPELPSSDKVQHFAAFLTLAILGVGAYPRTKKRVLLAGLAAFGALIEIVQALPWIGRDSDPSDWIVDIAAALAALASIALWRLWKQR